MLDREGTIRSAPTTDLSLREGQPNTFNSVDAFPPQNSIVYSFNKHKFPKWIYNYESGATKR